MFPKVIEKFNKFPLLYLGPLFLVLFYFLFQSLTYNIHDFSNSYFSAKLIRESLSSNLLFDIYEFNSYIWNLGYTNVLVDFYINSPFTITFFYPFTFIENPYIAKAIYNLISIVLFSWSLYLLVRYKFKKRYEILFFLPILFFVPIRNGILFGQSYFLIFALVVFGFLSIENKKEKLGVSLISIAVLLKIFPVFYGVALLFYKNWKAIMVGIISSLILISFSIVISGVPIWETYLLEILPNAIQNNSTVDFRYNAQSMDVFLKTLFIEDSYYNPDALFNNEQVYILLKWLFKSVVIALAVGLSFKNKKDLFRLLSFWVVALFLLQSRTATYAQILWFIPMICLLNQKISNIKKTVSLLILLIICNIPVYQLEPLPIFFKFLRLWFTILLSLLFFSSFSIKPDYKWFIMTLVVLLPLHLGIFKKTEKSISTYVLKEKEYFLIYDYFENEGSLHVKTLGKKGNQTINLNIPISAFNENISEVVGNQIKLGDQLILEDYSLKKKPVLVNNKELYYLTDHHSRRGAFTLKKINIEAIH